MSILEKLARKALNDKKVQVWLSMLIEVDGNNNPKILKCFSKVAKQSAVKQATKSKKPVAKPVAKPIEKKLSKITEGGDLFD